MTGQLELWTPGWEVEPCDTADPDEQAFLDLHARPRTRAADRLRELRERRVEPEAGRAAGGRRLWTPGGDDIRITTITPPRRYL
ncbi:hypothetical protein ACFWJT_15675 [Streptomyces sp. NPDC127069]|uniref:hypothetical protein n=1 Tax=Streptomyces sp. NPDC127069 TaxID=3347128 RepID=UPI003663CCC5